MKKDILVYLFLTIFILTGCSIQKRHYSRGFSLDWGGNALSENKAGRKSHQTPSERVKSTKPDKENTLVTSAETQIEPQFGENFKITEDVTADKKDTCDMIELKNKKYILAKVKEINPDYIVFKKCGDPKGRDYRIPVSKLSKIIFADSSLQPIIFQKGQPVPKRVTDDASDGSDDSTKVSYRYVRHSESFGGFSILAFFIACLAAYLISIFFPVTLGGIFILLILYCLAIAAGVVSFVFAILAIAFALKSLKNIFKSPKKFTGEEEAYTGLSRGITIFTLLLIAGLYALYLIYN